MKIHFIGIGGIGVSALAKYYLSQGIEISGSDSTKSEITDFFQEKRVSIHIGDHDPNLINKTIDKVIYSPAVPEDNPERKKAQELGLKVQSYPQALGELTKNHFTIAVAGSHGKSTIAAMIGLILEKAGFDPTVIIGTKVKQFNNSNERTGQSKYLVIEACEHFSSFLNYSPNIIVLSNIEADHLDFYKNMDNLLQGFRKFIDQLPEDGLLIANKDSKNIKKIVKDSDNIKWYSLENKEKDIIKLQVPGEFNISNALGALKLARTLDIDDQISLQALSEYENSWRRFEIIEIKKPKPYILINDYGHHPTQLRETLKAAREKYPDKKIWCFFQPHQYQRTHYLFDQFVETLQGNPIDKIFIDKIYSVEGREKEEIKDKVSSKKLVKAVNKDSVVFLPQEEIEDYLQGNVKGEEVVILMGAGNIYKNVASKIIKKNK
jgi:UDP-N-acetylmuramate--alanine ligase